MLLHDDSGHGEAPRSVAVSASEAVQSGGPEEELGGNVSAPSVAEIRAHLAGLLRAREDQLARRDDLLAYLDAVYGTGSMGYVTGAVGTGQYWDGPKYKFKSWDEGRAWQWPAQRAEIATTLLDESRNGADVYLCPYLMNDRKRSPNNAFMPRMFHADIDGGLTQDKLDMLAEIGGFAVGSGSEGHGHVYVPLPGAVPTLDEHRGLCEALGEALGYADAKKSANDVLRPPGTLNHKPTARDGSPPTPVQWLVRPRKHPAPMHQIAAALGIATTETPAPVRNGKAAAQALGADWSPLSPEGRPLALPPPVDSALRKVTGDRSADTMRVVGACVRSGLTLDQTRSVVATRDDLHRRLEGRKADDVAKCWERAEGNADGSGWTAEEVEEVRLNRAMAPLNRGGGGGFWREWTGDRETDLANQVYKASIRKDAAEAIVARERENAPESARVLRPGGSFVLDAPANPVPIWGRDGDVLMAEGEALTIVGGSGVGKTTTAQQVAMGRAGVPGFEELFGLPIASGKGRVLYLAMDRPAQAVRSLRRMVTEEHRALLDERLMIWPGPPPAKLTEDTEALLRLCRDAEADTVVVDSLKDVGSVVDDEGGTGWNMARQMALAEGVQVLELHHNRKGGLESLDDVYGSTWITSGAGSVVALVGSAGDSIVKLRHLKQPADTVGPLDVMHDHVRGRSMVWNAVDLRVLAARPEGVTAAEVACALFDTTKPAPNEREKARRRLVAGVKAGWLVLLDKGDKAQGRPAKWGAK